MSGGYFDYDQYKIAIIAESIQSLIEDNKQEFSDETIAEFKKGIEVLNRASVYAQRIDWLVSCDDSEESFHKRLAHDLDQLEK